MGFSALFVDALEVDATSGFEGDNSSYKVSSGMGLSI